MKNQTLSANNCVLTGYQMIFKHYTLEKQEKAEK